MSTLAFIAKMKLQALRSQRDTLEAEYQSIIASAEAAETDADRLRALYEGLRSLRLAGDLVHPELPDVTATLKTLDFAAPSEIESWQRRLRGELDRGRARSEAVYAFGALLEDSASDVEEPIDESGRAEYLERAVAEPGPEPAALADGGLLDQVFADGGFDRLVAGVEKVFADGFGTVEVTRPGVDGADQVERQLAIDASLILGRIGRDRERPAALRGEARQFAGEMTESHVALRDALEMSLADPSAWDWPSDPLTTYAVATGDRVRFHPNLDLVSLLVLEQLAVWFSHAFPLLHSGHANRKNRLVRLLELNAPEVIIANERRLFEEEIGLLNDPRILHGDTSGASIAARRDLELASMWNAGMVAGSHYGYAADSTRLLRVLGAELAIHEASDRPFFAVRTDIADCFASIDHRVVHSMLERLGVPEPYRALARRYLGASVELEGGAAPVRRGVLLSLSLSREFADLILGAIELSVRRTGVGTARVVDDLVIWSDDVDAIERGYAALLDAVAQVGLALQPAKTGAVAVAAPRPASLPEGPIRFNLLSLGPEGFAIDPVALDELCASTRTTIESSQSVLAAVRAYNDQVRFLFEAVVPHPDLTSASGDHLAACGAALKRFADTVVDGGIEAYLQDQIAQRWTLERPLPRAWLYWPVSAGGLGLRDAMLELGAIPTARSERPAEEFDELASKAWGKWYASLFEPRTAVPPRESAVSKAQLDDFIARGGELRGSAQAGLSVYWKWVLNTHGPEILERFGTFRFLLRKLVPLDLLSR